MRLSERIIHSERYLAGAYGANMKNGPIGSAIGGGLSLAGGLAASKMMGKALNGLKDQMKEIQQQKTKSATHTDAQLYAGPNAADQAAITNAQAMNEEAIQAASNNVVGSTPEAAALQKQAAAQNIGSMLQQQSVARNQRQTAAWTEGQSEAQNWQKYLNDTRQQMNQVYMAQAQAVQDAAKGAAQSANSLQI